MNQTERGNTSEDSAAPAAHADADQETPGSMSFTRKLLLAYDILPLVGYFLLDWSFLAYFVAYFIPLIVGCFFHFFKVFKAWRAQRRAGILVWPPFLFVIIFIAMVFTHYGLIAMVPVLSRILFAQTVGQAVSEDPLGLDWIEVYVLTAFQIYTQYRRYRDSFIRNGAYLKTDLLTFWYRGTFSEESFLHFYLLAVVALAVSLLNMVTDSLYFQHLFVIGFTFYAVRDDLRLLRRSLEKA